MGAESGQIIAASLQGAAQLAPGLGGLFTSLGQADAIRAQSDFQANQLLFNSRLAEIQAEDVVRRAERDVQELQRRTQRTLGTQRAALAAQGVDISTGTAVDIQAGTAGISAIDALIIRNNAQRQALGFKLESLSLASSAGFTQSAADFRASQTILGGVGQLAGGFARFSANQNIFQPAALPLRGARNPTDAELINVFDNILEGR